MVSLTELDGGWRSPAGLVLEADPSVEALTSALVVAAKIPESPAGTLIGHTTVRMLRKPR